MAKQLSKADKLSAATRYKDGESAIKISEELGVSRSTVTRWGNSVESLREDFKAVPKKFGEFGVTGLNRFGTRGIGSSIIEDYLTPWENLSTMIPLVREMADDPIIGSVLFAIEMMIRQSEEGVVPFSESEIDQSAAKFLEECLIDLTHTFSEHISQVVSFVKFGWSCFEVVYKRRTGLDAPIPSQYNDGLIGWKKFAFRSQDTLAPGREWLFDDNGAILGMNQQAPPDFKFVSIPISKMILYRTNHEKNNPQGRSALRAAYRAWYYSKNLSEIEGIAAERMGAGLPVMYLGEGTKLGEGTDTDFEFAKKLVRDIRADEQMGVVIPYPKMTHTTDGKGALFEFVSPPSKGLIDFNAAIARYNQQMAQTLLAQFIFLGLAERGTQSLAIRQTDFFTQAIEGWLKHIADQINRFLIPTLFSLNESKFNSIGGFPKIEFSPIAQIDIDKFMEAISNAVGAGALQPDEGTERAVRQHLELPLIGTPEAGKAIEIPEPEGSSHKPGESSHKSPDLGKDKEAEGTDEMNRMRETAIEMLEQLRTMDEAEILD